MAIDREEGVRVLSVGELLAEDDLAIPGYQRPYSWEPATALQLLDDIVDALGQRKAVSKRPGGPSGSYVLGAVILHSEDERTNVVDGQQRLLTLTLLLDLLDAAAGARGPDLDPQVPNANPSAPVTRVRDALERRIKHMSVPAGEVAEFIRERCWLMRVETDDADEAFRVFDSQNYRGKPLLPHDLLKAYHLREMTSESLAMKTALVEGWESVPDSDLDRLFSTYLWRIKRWSRGMAAPVFTSRDVGAFKGMTAQSADTPASRYHLVAQAAVPMLGAWADGSAESHRIAGRTRFQLDAPVTAGRPFFEMVTFTLHELRELRKEGYAATGWDRFASTDADLVEISSRSRYRYVSELYLAALLYFTNKFGDEMAREARSRLFRWAYGLRTQYQRVQWASVNNHARDGQADRSAFVLLRNAESAAEIRRLVTDVKGREQNPAHERDLLLLLEGLEG